MEKLTTKQRGDAAEHYVISMLGFNNIPAAKMPDNWPGYDLVAQRRNAAKPLRISVRFRTDGNYGPYARYKPHEPFDFIAVLFACLARDVEVNFTRPPRGKRERKLIANAAKGRKLLDEFAKCERDTDALSVFVRRATFALAEPDRQEWPTPRPNQIWAAPSQ
jgi:hypothetical protein